VGAQHDLQMTGEIFFAEQFGDAGHALAFFTGNLKQGRVLPGNFRDRGIAQEAHHLAGEVCRAVALADEVVDLAKNFVAGAAGDGLHDFFENVRRRCADEAAH
jgi:hypothetical protein